jgi:CYTH domain-containing protein
MKKIETERKFIIKKPSENLIASQNNFTESEITQIYLENPKMTHRVRKRKYADGKEEFTENTKLRISGMSVIETERLITESEYNELSLMRAQNTLPLKKMRRTFDYIGKTFEIDLYDAWCRTCIMEVEMEREDEKVEFPPFIEIICEVTGERKYSNHAMSESFPEEISI